MKFLYSMILIVDYYEISIIIINFKKEIFVVIGGTEVLCVYLISFFVSMPLENAVPI